MIAYVLQPVSPRATVILIGLVLCALLTGCRQEGEPEPGPVPAEVGSIVTSAAIDPATNAPLDVRHEFATEAGIIYAVAEIRWVEEGVTFFARWTHEGEPLADSEPVTAEQRYENVYLEFHLRPIDGSQLEAGAYAVQIHVNGVPGPSATFSVQ
jgi:hypothetical protein